jgi:hypothetical protein
VVGILAWAIPAVLAVIGLGAVVLWWCCKQ